MSVTEEASAAATSTDVDPGDIQKSSGDEQGGVSLTGTPELSDPAILAVNPKFRYGKEELLKLREAPLSQRKPDFVDINEVSSSIWNSDKKKSETPTENGSRNNDELRRRNGDPRERIRKENDGIVLSPQRRSFNSGCFVPGRETRNAVNRPHSPLGKAENNPHLGGTVREIQTNSRRIGSGRILRDTWDFGEKPESGENDFSFRPQTRTADSQDRRFGRDFETVRDKEKDRRSTGRFGDRRRISGGDSRDEEPEWFSGGPSSQNDTIELRGFDDSDRINKRTKRARDWLKKKSDIVSFTEEKDENNVQGGRSTPTPQVGGVAIENDEKLTTAQKSATNAELAVENDKQSQDKHLNDQSYIFEDILKSDTIPGLPGLLTNGVGGDGDCNSKSRFSKWFSVDTNTNQTESRRSSGQDEAIIKNLLKDINDTSVSIPGDSNSYFAPISPAANTGSAAGSAVPPNSKSINIMEMLQRSKQNDTSLKSQVPGRIMNLNELEAKMRQTSEPQMHKPVQQKTEEDLTAFNRLLAHISGNHTTSNGPMSLMEMLSRSQQQDEAHARMSQLLGPVSPSTAPHDLASRIHQVQNQQQQKQQQVDMLTKLMNAGMQMRASPLPDMGLQQSRDLLSRPEAQAILQAIHQRIPSPRELQVHTQNILQRALIKKKLEEQQENYRKKQELQQRGQSPNNNMNTNNNSTQQPPKSVSSPTPLAFTPTSVLRKMTAEKDEGGKDVTKLVDGKLSQGRAVTGMRAQAQQQQQQRDQQQQQSLGQWPPFQMNMKQAGRPIVKANNFQAPQQEQFFTQQQQQKFLSQLQQQHQRKSYHSHGSTPGGPTGPHQQYPNSNQQFSQLTQQQLRAQHQQQSRPSNLQQAQQHQTQQSQFGSQQGGATWQQFLNPQQNRGQVGRGGLNDGDMSPTSNQLTRWFSPDLLERARVGELPSTAGLSQHLLSLEEIERLTAPPVHN